MFAPGCCLVCALPNLVLRFPARGAKPGQTEGQSLPSSPPLARVAWLSAELQALQPLAEPTRQNKKLPVAQLKEVIRKLCEGRWLATSELAALVREGALELRYPEIRNRPDQAYRTVSD